MTGEEMNYRGEWESSAEDMMAEMPSFVKMKVRKTVEQQALRKGMSKITGEFLNEIISNMMGGNSGHKETGEGTIRDFYALTDNEPILAGFKRRSKAPHAGMGSMAPVEDGSRIWDEVSRQTDSAKARALYIHTPFCLARCKFCGFYHSKTNKDAISAYVDDLLVEMDMIADSAYASSTPFNAVYFGGGTPTDIAAEDLKRIMTHLQSRWNLTNDCEITLEGRLHGFDDDKMAACLEHGVNRFSFGIQSFDTRIRRSMGRIEKKEVLLKRLEEILETNGANVSIDLIYGFPEQSHEIWLDDLKSAVESGVDSASIYRLKPMPDSPIQELVEQGRLSPPASVEIQAEQFALSNDFFRTMNARRSGVTHWAFSNRERCVYNSISAYGGSILPVGCGAGGNLGKYGVMQGMSLQEYSAYIERGEKPLGAMVIEKKDNRALRMLGGELHLNLGVNLKEHARKTGEEGLNEIFAPLLEQWDEAGMVSYDRESGLMRLTDAGVFHAPQIQQNLLDYYEWKKGGDR